MPVSVLARTKYQIPTFHSIIIISILDIPFEAKLVKKYRKKMALYTSVHIDIVVSRLEFKSEGRWFDSQPSRENLPVEKI